MKKKYVDHYSGIGGQAVIEGIMMKNGDKYSVAVRTPEGDINVSLEEYESFAPAKILNKMPFIRGIFNFIDSLILGIRTLNYSASFYEDEEERAHKKDSKDSEVKEKLISGITVTVSLMIAIALFMLLPYFLSQFIRRWIVDETVVAILEGVIRVVIFVVYLVAISAMKDIRRVFMYHGAEHKCINCLERGKPLTLENVKASTRLHKRCGSSFILFVMFISIILFFFIRVDSYVMKVVIRILLIPVISGISYEIIRLAGRTDFFLVRLISAPGLLLQRLTTKEPDEEMVKVAIKSVEAVFDWKEFLKDSFGYEVDDSWLEDEPKEDTEA